MADRYAEEFARRGYTVLTFDSQDSEPAAARCARPRCLHERSPISLRRAERLRVPTLFVHGDECALPDNVKRIHQRMLGQKRMVWDQGFQVDWYDRPDRVTVAVEAADEHFDSTLRS